MKADLVPSTRGEAIRISCAGNDYEPFLLVLAPNFRVDNVRISASDLKGPAGAMIPAENVSIRHVDYVRVEIPSDDAGRTGWWPDPLPPYDGPFTLPAGENHSLWLTVFVPAGMKTGEFRGTVTVAAGPWQTVIPLELRVRNFVPPKTPSIYPSKAWARAHSTRTKKAFSEVFTKALSNAINSSANTWAKSNRTCRRTAGWAANTSTGSTNLIPRIIRSSGRACSTSARTPPS